MRHTISAKDLNVNVNVNAKFDFDAEDVRSVILTAMDCGLALMAMSVATNIAKKIVVVR